MRELIRQGGRLIWFLVLVVVLTAIIGKLLGLTVLGQWLATAAWLSILVGSSYFDRGEQWHGPGGDDGPEPVATPPSGGVFCFTG